MARYCSKLLMGLLLLTNGSGQSISDLSQLNWTVRDPGNNVSVPGNFPSQAHLDLYEAEVIGDPYYRLNEFDQRWVANSNWTYSAVLAGLMNRPSSTYLIFHGLDTFTSIEICNQHVASTNNQFRQYYFDVTRILQNCSSDPVLSINFGSAPNIVNDIAAEPGQETWPYNVELVYQFPNRQFMRKEQSDFGWDWGPAFAPAGPWQPAYCVQLEASAIFVRNTLIDIYRRGQLNNIPPDQTQPWVVNASLDFIGKSPRDASMSFELEDAAGQIVHSGDLQDVHDTDGAISGMALIPDAAVDLWWPNGLGAQTLYNMTVIVLDAGQKIASVGKRVGFRTIVLNEGVVTQEQISRGVAPGNNWHFEINGHPFFAKGSNFIPPDVFWPRVTEDKIRQLFDSVVAGKQNMLRVWASGAYSPDFMYDLADQMGILLWSEFEFGDCLYPVNQVFLANVFEEVNYQVRRVNYHPSLAFWAGGNELENLELATVNQSAPDQYEKYKNEYETLFLNTIVPAIFDNSRSISYAPSSTSNGYISFDHNVAPYFTERYGNVMDGSIYGETDYYNYNDTVAFDTADYPVGRFSNEFGFHSMPSLQTWLQAVAPEDLYFNSSVVQLRNRHYPPGSPSTSNFHNTSLGMGEMTRAVQTWYSQPTNISDPVANFSAWCHATQVFQADYYASQISFYRRGSGMRQRTLGILYWQLEDIWQAPSWASIEYGGRWKILHYKARDMYSNVIISPFYNESFGNLTVYATSDLWEDVSGTVDAAWYDWSGETLDDVEGLTGKPVTIGALNTTLVYASNTHDLLKSHGADDVVLRMNISVTGHLPNNATQQTFSHTNWFHASRLTTANLVDPGLTLDYDAGSQAFSVEATKGVAAWVWLDYPRGAVVAFEENGFWLEKGEKRYIGYSVKNDLTGAAWMEGVKVQSLWDQKVGNADAIVTA